MAYKGQAPDHVVREAIDRAVLAIAANDEMLALDVLQEVEALSVEWPWAFFGWEYHKDKLVELKKALDVSSLKNTQVHVCVLILDRNFNDCLKLFAALEGINIHPYCAYINMMALTCTLRYEAAREVAIPLMEQSEPGSFIFERVATTYDMACEGLDPVLAFSLLDRFADKVEGSTVLSMFAGIRHIQNGNVIEANDAFSFAAMGARNLPTTIRGVKTIAPLFGLDVIKYFDFERWYDENCGFSFYGQISTGDGDFVIACACNDEYFRLYGALWIEAVSVSNRGANVHVNLINPTDETISCLDGLRSNFSGLHLNFSIERTRFVQRAYFACSRFFVAPILIKLYNRKLIITDIDIIVGGDGKDLSLALDKHSFGVKELPGWRLPWQKYIADFVCVKNDNNGLIFIKLINCFLGKNFAEKGEDIWWVDQVALFVIITQLSHKLGFEIFNPDHATKDLIHLGGIELGDKLGWLIPKMDRMKLCLADLKKKHVIA